MIGKTTTQIKHIIRESNSASDIVSKFLTRLNDGLLTREENPKTHFGVFFAGFDRTSNKLLMGHHKKSNLWLFNGGHIEKGEIPSETLIREIEEEWGEIGNFIIPKKPGLLTISEIKNSAKRSCIRHYDIWYFVPMDKESNKFNPNILLGEFYEVRWLTLQEAKNLATDPTTLKAIDHIEKHLFK